MKKIYFQKKNFSLNKEIENFSKKNANVGSIISFVGKVRGVNNNKRLKSLNIHCYKKMALHQTKKIVKNIKKKNSIIDFLIIHRFGCLFPTEKIVLILVATKHRNEGFEFVNTIISWFKSKITFWKKEIYYKDSEWLEKQK